jgi:hypothetical protein
VESINELYANPHAKTRRIQYLDWFDARTLENKKIKDLLTTLFLKTGYFLLFLHQQILILVQRIFYIFTEP